MAGIDQPSPSRHPNERIAGLPYQSLGNEQFNRDQMLKLLILCGTLYITYSAVFKPRNTGRESLPLVNRLHALEPRIFARLRWAIFARDILQRAYDKFGGKPYRLDRGDAEYVVLPARYIPELNRLPHDILETRRHHSFSLLGHLTGMHVILKTSYHVKTLLGRISPATAIFTPPMAQRMTARLLLLLSQDPADSQFIEPVDMLVRCVSEGLALTLFGPPVCDNPELVRLCHEHTKNVFTIAFCMRVVPAFLQPFAVWLLPAKWRLERGWSTWDRIVVPEVRRRLQEVNSDAATRGDLISWMVRDAKSAAERDERTLTHLSAAVIAGATYSTANLTAEVLMDLVARPDILEEIRDEIREKHIETGGRWDMAALDSLPKLESALKETSRLTPGAMFVYQRFVARDVTLSDGTQLRRGQFLTTASQEALMATRGTGHDAYDGLRFHKQDPKRHLHAPFRGLDGDVLTWGSGRWACPGRVVANMMIKILLVKVLDEYELSFVGGKRPSTTRIHEFLMLNPMAKVRIQRREEYQGIEF